MEHKEVSLSIVLPCYNESKSIENILKRFETVGNSYNYELILVNNGSVDDSQQVMDELIPKYAFAKSVTIEKNKGYGDGIFTGLKESSGEVLAWSHADLQTDPADIFKAYDLFQQSDTSEKLIVKGIRHGRSLSENIITAGMQFVAFALLWRWISEINAQPKVFDRSLMEHVKNPPVDFNFDLYVLISALRKGWKIKTIDVEFPPRQHGQSNWASSWRSKVRTIWGSIKFMLKIMTGSWK